MRPLPQTKDLILPSGLLLALLVSACAKEQNPSPAPPPSNQAQSAIQIEPVSSLPLAIEAIATHSSLRCASLRDCPSHVGLLFSADSAGGFLAKDPAIAACTAVLVGPDLVLTNSHCIPPSVKLLPELCSERVKIVFPGNAIHREARFSCKELLGSSERATPMSPDLALIRLERKTKRRPTPVDRNGVADGSALRVYKVNPKLKNLSGELVSSRCRSVANSYRMPVYRGAEDSTVVLGDCAALPGNSGSPILNEKGELLALLQADLPISDQSLQNWKPHLDSPDQEFARLAMGTSLRCLAADPTDGWRWNDACTTIQELDVALARPRIRQFLEEEKLKKLSATILKPFLEQSPWFGWSRLEIETKPLRRKELLMPSCLKEGDDLPSRLSLELQFPILDLELRFNRYLQLTAPRATLAEVKNQRYELVKEKRTLSPTDAEGDPIPLPLCEP